VYATHIDVYYFCVVKMEKGYTIAVGFVKKVHNRGFTQKNENPKLTLRKIFLSKSVPSSRRRNALFHHRFASPSSEKKR